LEIDQYLMKF